MPLRKATGRLAGAQVFAAVTAFITGPLQARALGPDGRGALAAILVPLTVIPLIANFGLNVYVSRMAARGAQLGRLLGSIGALVLGVGVVLALLSVPLAHLLAGGRHVVFLSLAIGFGLMPLSLLTILVLWLNQGLEQWQAVVWHRLIPPLLMTAGLIALYVTDHLTVGVA